MVKSLLRRFLYTLLLLWIISLIAFWLSQQVPGDVVMDYISIDDRGYHVSAGPLEHRLAYERVAKKRGLDLREFYVSVYPGNYPDSINRILPYEDRNVVKKWIHTSGNGEGSLLMYKIFRSGLFANCGINKQASNDLLCNFFNRSLGTENISLINENAKTIKQQLANDTTVSAANMIALNVVIEQSDQLMTGPIASAIPKYRLPSIKWNGFHNQYHQWITGLFFQKPVTSLVDGRNAWSKIYDSLKWTLLLNGFALLVAIFLGIAIGIWSALKEDKAIEKLINGILFALFALPSFWLGTLLIYFFSSGEWLSVFPASGLGSYHAAGNIFERVAIIFGHLFLPVTCLALGSIAYVSRQMKQSLLHELAQPYVLHLRAQGISEKTIVNKHAIRNAIFPIITIIGGAVPVLLSGSLIIEVIFSIPGMGRLMYNSLLSRDWPVVFPVLMLGAIVTILSYHLSDIMYKWMDPRVKTIGR